MAISLLRCPCDHGLVNHKPPQDPPTQSLHTLLQSRATPGRRARQVIDTTRLLWAREPPPKEEQTKKPKSNRQSVVANDGLEAKENEIIKNILKPGTRKFVSTQINA